MLRIAVLAVSLAAVAAIAQDSPPRVADLVARNSYTFDVQRNDSPRRGR